MILSTNWYIGGIENTWTSANFYVQAHKTLSSSAFSVGLFSPEDYGFATSGGNTARTSCVAAALNGSSYTTNCRNNNWLYNRTYHQWSIIARPSSANNQVYYITSAGLSAYQTVTYGTANYKYRPCVYLKPNVVLNGGDGSSSNPYQIS